MNTYSEVNKVLRLLPGELNCLDILKKTLVIVFLTEFVEMCRNPQRGGKLTASKMDNMLERLKLILVIKTKLKMFMGCNSILLKLNYYNLIREC